MKLRLDFAHPRPAPAALGWVLLALGVLALAWAGWRHQSVSEARQTAVTHLATLAPKPVSKRPAARAETDAPATRRLLDADWARLLDALEQSRPANVALLRVEAEAARGSLFVAATARDAAAMLAYLERLEKLPVLARVAMVSHRDEETEGLRTVRFDLRAQWGAP